MYTCAYCKIKLKPLPASPHEKKIGLKSYDAHLTPRNELCIFGEDRARGSKHKLHTYWLSKNKTPPLTAGLLRELLKYFPEDATCRAYEQGLVISGINGGSIDNDGKISRF